jgi:Flp pilus assembly protein TadD
MKRYVMLPLLTALLLCALPAGAAAQGRGRGATGVTHKLYGDFKVDESKAEGNTPGTFHIILYTVGGQIIARQSINNNGRYRFEGVPNGEYEIVVEMENTEVARIPLVLNQEFPNDIRRDIVMEWRGLPSTKKAGIVSATDYYDRTPANKDLFDKSQAAIKKNDHKQAIALLQQIVSADAKDYQAWTELGTCYFKQEKLGEAEKAFRGALAAKPTFMLALLNLGKTQVAQKNFEAAVETLTKAVEADPRSAQAQLFLGESYLQIKKGSKAVVHLNEALRLDPAGSAEAHLRLAALYNAAGMKDRAAAEYEQFLAKKPDYPEKKKLEQYISEHKRP